MELAEFNAVKSLMVENVKEMYGKLTSPINEQPVLSSMQQSTNMIGISPDDKAIALAGIDRIVGAYQQGANNVLGKFAENFQFEYEPINIVPL